MKAVILAGGLGTRLSEETDLKPKPMVEIGGRPILWHIMKTYSAHGVNDFVICCGYKGQIIKEYFANYFLHQSDVTFCMKDNSMQVHQNNAEPWTVTLVDTGENTMTAGRLKRVKNYVKDEEAFCFTYGDAVSDVNVGQLIKSYYAHGKQVTVTAIRSPGRFGRLIVGPNSIVDYYEEKPKNDGSWINGGYFVVNPAVIDIIPEDSTSWEFDMLPLIVSKAQLAVFKHEGFTHPMDTLREKNLLNELWNAGKAPWKVW